ncbi:DUF2069 domain-containing protein [Arenimonas oryziterrae]|uniref:DUF2069 domain-containing protein n=1 Tax=Arenimonas oryziterrae DSM 21050 = YC6267 TaxID=1121015 RepID=A0A091AT10_9GAMM|nr:DUF2069 domain-containing protein [Arenimonas oryziterrae]KFN43333.1 hypothetical protein N789_08650 [Arenimonas oryziterrae DSM 21050 = YC6267]
MSLSKRYAALGILALLALQWLWHAQLMPPERADRFVVAALFSLPILPAATLVLLRHRQAAYWGGIAALLYFSHGIMETWSAPGAWPLGLTEAALSVWVVVAGSWEGMQARFNKPKPPPTNV